jgi:hypothetical protein
VVVVESVLLSGFLAGSQPANANKVTAKMPALIVFFMSFLFKC